MNKDKQVMENM
jgi:Thioredoxin